jgi:hypothetical protein
MSVIGPWRFRKGVFERVSELCLPPARGDGAGGTRHESKARSTARSFDIRRRSSCLLIAFQGANGTAVPEPVLRPTQPIVR